MEYLLDYASPATREVGKRRIAAALAEMDDRPRRTAEKLVAQVQAGERDVFV